MRKFKPKIITNILFILLALLGIGALSGGGVLIISFSWKLFSATTFEDSIDQAIANIKRGVDSFKQNMNAASKIYY